MDRAVRPSLYDEDDEDYNPEEIGMERKDNIRRVAKEMLQIERAKEWLLGDDTSSARIGRTRMKSQPESRPLASVEGDLFGTLFSFHQKTMTLLRESSLNDDKLKVVSDRIKALLDDATADMKATQQSNLAKRLEATYQEAKRLVEELSHSDDGKKAKPRKRRLKGRKNKQ